MDLNLGKNYDGLDGGLRGLCSICNRGSGDGKFMVIGHEFIFCSGRYVTGTGRDMKIYLRGWLGCVPWCA